MDTKELVGLVEDEQWEHKYGYIVDNNHIVALLLFPGEIGVGSPINNNQIFFWRSTPVTPTITNLKELRILILDNNRLKSLPENIGDLTNLEILRANENQLEHIPESIGNLKSLKTLSLYNNKLSSLPDSMANLSNLKDLSVGENKLIEIPEWAYDLIMLEVFDFQLLKRRCLLRAEDFYLANRLFL